MTAPPYMKDEATEQLARLFTERTGQHLSESRLWRMDISLRPILREHSLASRASLAREIATDPGGQLARQVIDALLNHESSFFRDPAMFNTLEQDVLPAIHRAKAGSEQSLRIWCAGAAKGQEPYSMAMILKRMGAMWDGWRITLLATDVSGMTVDRAATGRFNQIEVQRGLPIDELLRWFQVTGDDWVVREELRAMISFRAENILSANLVAGQFDLILCRNVLLYFGQQEREAALRILRARSVAGGHLMLGAGETVQDHLLFKPSANFRSVYLRAEQDSSQS